MPDVETRDIDKHFDDVKAVNGVNIVSSEEEFLVLLGPSGCGKTTLLRMIAGLEKPTSGEILIGGQVVTHLPPRARGIAMVFQSYALYPHMTISNNIAFPLKAVGMPKDDREKKVQWAAAMLGIEHLLQRKPRELSGGERQRVALARALVREPNVFLLDEPLSNLDAKLRASAREELYRFQKRYGITTIYVTHDQVEAMGMGDRIAVMNAGKVRQLGTPDEVYTDPADTFVAGFLGSPPMNLVETQHRSSASARNVSCPGKCTKAVRSDTFALRGHPGGKSGRRPAGIRQIGRRFNPCPGGGQSARPALPIIRLKPTEL